MRTMNIKKRGFPLFTQRGVSLFLGLSLFVMLLSACGIEIEQTNLPPTATQVSIQAAAPIPPAESVFGFSSVSQVELNYKLAADWDKVDATGKLIFLSRYLDGQALVVFDLETGQLSPIFNVNNREWLLSASLNAAQDAFLIAYEAQVEGQAATGSTDLYRLTAENISNPELLLETGQVGEAYNTAVWSPAAEALTYFLHFFRQDDSFYYEIQSFDLTTRQTRTIAQDAYWLALSPDAQRIVYIPHLIDSSNVDQLWIANADGSDPKMLLSGEKFDAIDAPFFSADGRYLFFSAVTPEALSSPGLEKWFGISVALAHNVPSDIWQVELETNKIQKVTDLLDINILGAGSPDGERIAFISTTGLWIGDFENGEFIQVLDSPNLYGNLQWVP